MQVKTFVVMAFLVITITLAGGWLYFSNAKYWLGQGDKKHADLIGKSISLASQHDLLNGNSQPLERLVSDSMGNEEICYVAILDSKGGIVCSAYASGHSGRWGGLAKSPPSISAVNRPTRNLLTLSHPIIAKGVPGHEGQLIGAIRLVLDTSVTTVKLAKLQLHVCLIGATLVIMGLPIGYWLVWRLMVQPINKLVLTTRRFGRGDFEVRSKINRDDEVGELAFAFDTMADEVSSMRAELVIANERLEQKVIERTMELEQSNQQLIDEMAEKEDFLRAVSHDLNAPLRNIGGMATLLMMKWKDQLPEEITARLQRIQSNVDIESDLISDLLELSRIKTMPQQPEMVDMNELVKAMADNFEYELDEKNIALEINGPMPSLYVEKNRIRQVFQNLLDNAIKYMDKSQGGKICIGYRFVDKAHQFYVSDNGPGIASEEQKKIFYVFRRAKNTASAGVSGKGVGLALVKSVASKYQGRAWVKSQLGDGATFYFTLAKKCTDEPIEELSEKSEEAEVQQDLVDVHFYADNEGI